MARVKLTTEAVEESTYVITLAFANKAGAAVTPDSATWTLTDGAGTVINSRSGVTIAPLAASVDVVLSGLDLAMQAGETGYAAAPVDGAGGVQQHGRGKSLPLNEEYQFQITRAGGGDINESPRRSPGASALLCQSAQPFGWRELVPRCRLLRRHAAPDKPPRWGDAPQCPADSAQCGRTHGLAAQELA
jgi:hypothetical protein